MRLLVLIRGLPGSGKTTMAKTLEMVGFVHCEADHYFEGAGGSYNFNRELLGAAHEECLDRAELAMRASRPVVVANTFTQRWEMDPYIKAASQFGYEVRVIEAKGSYQSVHGVPADAIERMRQRWEAA